MKAHLARRAPTYRIVLVGLGALLLIVSLLVPLLPSQGWDALRNGGANIRVAAAVCAGVWAAIDAVNSFLSRNDGAKQETLDALASTVQSMIEEGCLSAKVHASTTRCSILVWRDVGTTWKDRRIGETRGRLEVAYVKRGQGHVSSGLTWRVGMGVIGQSIEDNNALLREVEPLWAPLRSSDETAFDQAAPAARQGLTYAEFLLADHGGAGSTSDGAPTVFAVPIAKGAKLIGCAAVDVPWAMTQGVQAVARLVQQQLTALGYATLSDG